MGCVSSKFNDRSQPNVFHVWNIDDMGNKINPGEIVITETDLILYQRGKQPVRWPMKSLRCYGFDSELFSFESGRRCPTGPGVYAFRCRRAEKLFTVLQEHIQSVANLATTSTDEPNLANVTSATLVNDDDILRPANDNTVNLPTSQEPRYCSTPCPSLSSAAAATLAGIEVLPISHDPACTDANHYVNSDIIQLENYNSNAKEHEYVNTIVCSNCLPSTSSPPASALSAAAAVGTEHEYMNTGILTEGAAASIEPSSNRFGDVNANTTTKTNNDEYNQPAYCNIPQKPTKSRLVSQSSFSSASSAPLTMHSDANGAKPNKSIHVNGTKLKRDPFYSNSSSSPGPSSSTPMTVPSKTVHYAILDLNNADVAVANDAAAEHNVSDYVEIDGAAGLNDLSDDAPGGKGYVTIDFNKTAALLSSTTNRQKQTVEILKKAQCDSLSK